LRTARVAVPKTATTAFAGILAGGLNTIKQRNTLMKTILKLTLAVVVAGLLTECAMTGLREFNAPDQSISVNAQTNGEWTGRTTGQFMDQLTGAAVR
jgi:hypothetical protein